MKTFMNMADWIEPSVYWETTSSYGNELYALFYDGDIDVWGVYSESARVDWERNSGVLGFFHSQDPSFWLPPVWEVL